ncbi:MAG: SUF system NifU family Fe-S cluster assembly protein [Spirochaeta sp. LUC14_002_19_P3]|nr:MAG: SUF system NifU family Fe-S cluster assembly protein [Spirochaeta sp. LUC14_002_19_P3]
MNHATPALDNLYMEIILDHYKHPRNRTDLSHLDDSTLHENPSCGDSIKIEVIFNPDGTIRDARHDGHGCAISTASASLLSERLPGKTPAEARQFIAEFIAVLRGEAPPERLDAFGDLAALGGVVKFPLRVKCAALAWHALEKCLEGK